MYIMWLLLYGNLVIHIFKILYHIRQFLSEKYAKKLLQYDYLTTLTLSTPSISVMCCTDSSVITESTSKIA